VREQDVAALFMANSGAHSSHAAETERRQPDDGRERKILFNRRTAG
jgi:hypothetical protein